MVSLQQAGWTAENYQLIQQTAEDTFAAAARVRAVLRPGPAAVDRNSVTVPHVGSGLTLGSPTLMPPTRIGIKFTVPSDAIDDVEAVCVLVRRAAQTLAGAESRLLARGDTILVADINPATAATKIIPDTTATTVNKTTPLDGLATALGVLHQAGHFDEYALIAEPAFMAGVADVMTVSSGTSKLGGLLGEPYRRAVFPAAAGTTPPPKPAGALVALGSLDLVDIEPPTIVTLSLTSGDLTLRLQTRWALRVLDTTGVVPLELA